MSETGVRIGRYRLAEAIGSGGMATVHRAQDLDTGRTVAVKLSKTRCESNLASLRRELMLLQRLRHPGIVSVMEGGVHDGLPWYAMELLDGACLTDVVGSSPGLRPPSSTVALDGGSPSTDGGAPAGPVLRRPVGDVSGALTVFRRMCAPLAYLHGEGVVHGDLKPSNVFVRRGGLPCITDFGTSRRWGGVSGRESLDAGGRAGTAGYMAPEVILGRAVDARADLYAFGCMLYQALAGRLPFSGRDAGTMMWQQAHAEPQPLGELCPELPPLLLQLVMDLLCKDPARRLGYADDVDRVLAGLGAEGWPGDSQVPARPYLYRPELRGRDQLLAVLERRLDRAAAPRGAGGCLLLLGESGVGKSSLAAELAYRAGERRFTVVTADISSLSMSPFARGSEGATLAAFRPFLQHVSDRCVAGGPLVFDRLLGGRAAILAACEPGLARLSPSSSDALPAALPPEARRARLFAALQATLAACAEDGPLLLVLDDLHWADDLSIDLLGGLPDEFFARTRLVIVALARAEAPGLPDRLAELGQRSYVEQHAITALDPHTIPGLVEDMLACRPAPAPLLEAVLSHAAGHPFFVVEYLRAMIAAGHLRRDQAGRWTLQPAATGDAGASEPPVPTNLEGLIAGRLARLGAPAAALARVMAVLGREADLEVLATVSGRLSPALDDDRVFGEALSALILQQVVERPEAGVVRFIHERLRELLYHQLENTEKRRLHGEAARVLEQRASGGSGPRAGEGAVTAVIASHLIEAGDTARAVHFLERAGTHARRHFSNREAVAFYGRLLALEDQPGVAAALVRRVRWRRELASAYLELGRIGACAEQATAAAALLRRPLPAGRAGALLGIARVLGERVLRRRGRGTSPEERELLVELATIYELLATTTYFLHDGVEVTLLASLRSLQAAERAEDYGRQARLLAAAQLVFGLEGLPRVAARYERKADQALAHISDPATASWVFFLGAVHHTGLGHWQEVETRCQRVISLAEGLGFPRRLEEGWGMRGNAALIRGDFALAESCYAKVLDSSARGDHQTNNWGLVGLADARLGLGRVEEARAAVERATATLARGLGRPEQVTTRATLALTSLRIGDVKAARAAADEALAWIQRGPPHVVYNVLPYASTAETLLHLWIRASGSDRRELEARVRRMLRELHRCGGVFPVAAPAAALWRGVYDWHRGRRRSALRMFQRSRAAAARLQMAPQELRARLALRQTAALPSAEDLSAVQTLPL